MRRLLLSLEKRKRHRVHCDLIRWGIIVDCILFSLIKKKKKIEYRHCVQQLRKKMTKRAIK